MYDYLPDVDYLDYFNRNDYLDYFDYDDYFDYFPSGSKTVVPNPKIPNPMCDPNPKPYIPYMCIL